MNNFNKNKITKKRKVGADYQGVNKVAVNLLPDIPLENKVTAEDLNYLNSAPKYIYENVNGMTSSYHLAKNVSLERR